MPIHINVYSKYFCYFVFDIGTVESVQGNDTIENNKDVEMTEDEDHCRAEGLIRFEVHNVSKIKETVLSEPEMIRNLPW